MPKAIFQNRIRSQMMLVLVSTSLAAASKAYSNMVDAFFIDKMKNLSHKYGLHAQDWDSELRAGLTTEHGKNIAQCFLEEYPHGSPDFNERLNKFWAREKNKEDKFILDSMFMDRIYYSNFYSKHRSALENESKENVKKFFLPHVHKLSNKVDAFIRRRISDGHHKNEHVYDTIEFWESQKEKFFQKIMSPFKNIVKTALQHACGPSLNYNEVEELFSKDVINFHAEASLISCISMIQKFPSSEEFCESKHGQSKLIEKFKGWEIGCQFNKIRKLYRELYGLRGLQSAEPKDRSSLQSALRCFDSEICKKILAEIHELRNTTLYMS